MPARDTVMSQDGFIFSGMFWLLAALIVLAIIGAIIYEHKRRQKIEAFAAARGMQYQRRDDKWTKVDLGWPYKAGHSHRANNVMSGVHNGRPIVLFEHQWTTGGGKESQTHYARVTAMELPRELPKLTVKKEGVFGRAARRLGVKDIELESDQFNNEYRVAGDRRLAYDVLNPRFMEWMLEHDAPGFTISAGYVVYAVINKIDLAEIDTDVAYLDTIIDRLPRYVVKG